MRQGRWTSDTFSLPLRRYATMAALRVLVVFGVMVVASAYPASPYWMNGGRRAFAIPQMAMPAVPPQFFPNRALSFSGYFAGSGTPYQGQWSATRQDVPYYINEDGSMQVSAIMDDNLGSSHGYNLVDSAVSMDGSGLLISGGAGGVASSGSGRVDSAAPPQNPPEISTTTSYPDPEVNTVAGGASEEPTPSPTTATSSAEPEPTTTTTTAAPPPPPPPPPVAPAASEPAGASAPPPLPPQPPKKRTGGRSNQVPQHQPFPQDNNDNDNYGNPTINAWFPFVFGGSGGGNPNRAFNAAPDDDTQLTPNAYNPRPQYGRSSGMAGHSPVAIANSFSTGRNAMAHSVATAYGVPPSNTSSQQRN